MSESGEEPTNSFTLRVSSFEQAWLAGQEPRIETYLSSGQEPSSDAIRKELLVELVMIDLEFRWRRHAADDTTPAVASETAPTRLEDYLARFPEFLSQRELPIELICEEYRVRSCWGSRPQHEEFLARFPQHAETLKGRLGELDREFVREYDQSLADTLPSASAGDADTKRIHTAFEDYEVLEEIARGGMGVVYKARQIGLNRIVALKMIRSGELADAEEVKRFRTEAEASARLDHPGIVPIYEVGETMGQQYYSMAYINGRSLANRINEGPLPPRQAAELLLNVAEAMHYAHLQGVIHRDLKPANILLVERDKESGSYGRSSSTRLARSGRRATQAAGDGALSLYPRVTDFGLAKQVHIENDLTSTGQILGTPSYMPPEQARGDTTISPAADIYSLGAVLYAMLVGRPPFQAANVIETIQQVIHQDPVPPRRLDASLDRDIETICLKCLEKSLSRRYETADELVADLQRYLVGEPIKARPIGGGQRVWRWCCRNPALTALLAAAACLFVAGIGLVVISSQLNAARERTKADQLQLLAAEAAARAKETQLGAAREIAATQRYFALINGVRDRMREPSPGWAAANLEDLKEAAGLHVATVNRLELRNEAAACLVDVDLRMLSETPMLPGYRSHLSAFDPAGKRFASSTLKHAAVLTISVFQVPDGESIHTLTALSDGFWQLKHQNQDGFSCLSFVANGEALAVLTRSGWIYRWDFSESPPARKAYKFPLADISYASAAKLVFDPMADRAFVAIEGAVYAWDYTRTDAAPQEIAKGRVAAIDISPDGRWLAVGVQRARGQGARTLVLDTRTLEVQRELNIAGENVAVSRDGRMIVVRDGRALALLDVESGNTIRTFTDPLINDVHEGVISRVEFSPSAALLVTGGSDSTLRLWDVASGTRLLTVFLGGSDNIFPEFSPDERYLVTTGNMRTTLYELNGLGVRSSLAGRAWPIDAFDVARSTPLLVSSAGQGHFSRWNLNSGQLIDRWEVDASGDVGNLVAISHDGQQLVVNDVRLNRVMLRDLDPTALSSEGETGSIDPSSRLAVEDTLSDSRTHAVTKAGPVVFSHDDASLLGIEDDELLVSRAFSDFAPQWQWSNKAASSVIGRSAITSLAAGQQWVLAGASTGFVQVLRAADGQPVGALAVGSRVACVALSHEETLFACGTTDGSLLIAAVPSAEQLAKYAAHGDEIKSVAFSPDDQLLATASRDKTVRLWQRRGKEIEHVLTLRSPTGPFKALRFGNDGCDLFALVQGETAIRVWRLEQLREGLQGLNLQW